MKNAENIVSCRGYENKSKTEKQLKQAIEKLTSIYKIFGLSRKYEVACFSVGEIVS